MAVDEALLIEMHERPVLRFYSWQPFCLSLGYGQRSSLVDQNRLGERGYTLVRRPSGGGAILHAQEITWCLVLPATHPLAAGSIGDGYRRIALVIKEALRSLGIAATLQENEASRPALPACFETPAAHELLVDGRKLLGCARVQRRHATLQHASLPLTGDVAAISDLLVYRDALAREEAAESLRKRAITLADASPGPPVGAGQAAMAIVDAFRASYCLDFVDSELTSAEEERARALEAERYGNPDWICRR
ncbi:MAG: biotin/lipoate A/B protein ligase family protein [Anaerolineaceae bacterium]|nr:biotin/lipoate A/B protein ligase family protein [Anaerolineaceae bacterium]